MKRTTNTGTTLRPSVAYNPRSLNKASLDTLNNTVSNELWDISNNFVQANEILGDAFEKIETLEIDRDSVSTKIEEVYRLSVEGDEALAERISTVQSEMDAGDNTLSSQIQETNKVITDLEKTVATNKTELESSIGGVEDTVSENKTDIEAKLGITNQTVADLDKATSSQITNLQSDYNGKFANVNQTLSTTVNKLGQVEAKWGVQTNVNGKVSGIQMNNDGASSSFSVVADRFTITDGGTGNTIPPFEVVGGNTRIKSAFINTLQSDNWNGSSVGWAITRDGWAHFNNVTVRGTVYADSGVFNHVTINETCTYKGQINSNQIQDTAVTALNREASALNLTQSHNPTINQEICAVNITTPRDYPRSLQFLCPSPVTLSSVMNDSGSKHITAKMVMYYNGAVVGEGVLRDGGGNRGNALLELERMVVGTIPANTSGRVGVNVYFYHQDAYQVTARCPQTTSQFSIFKVSNELS